MLQSYRCRLNPYAFAVLSVFTVSALAQLLEPEVAKNQSLLFLIGVVLSGWYGGLKPGLLATLLATVAIECSSSFPLASFTVANLNDRRQLALFIPAAVIGCLPGANLERIRGKIQELDDRKQAEAALRQYERVVSSTPDGVALVDRAYTYQLVNQTYLARTQKQRAEIVGHPVSEIMGETLFQTVIKPQFDRCLAGETIRYEEWFDYPNDHHRFVAVTYSPHTELDGTISGVVVTTRDLTDLKQAEAALQQINNELEQRVQERTIALQESEEKFRQLAENINHVFCIENTAGQVLYVSPSYAEIWGQPIEALCQNPNTWLDAVHPEDYTHVTTQLAILREHFAGEMEYRIIRPDGEVRWISDRSFPVCNIQGEIYRIAGIAEDVTERKRIEQEIHRSRDLFEATFQESADAIFLVEIASSVTLDCNQRAVDLFEASSKPDLVGIQGYILHKELFSAEELAAAQQEFEIEGVWNQEIEYRTLKGRCFWGNLASKRIQVAELQMVLVRITDISDRKQAELHLQKQAEADQLLAAIAQKISQSVQLDEVLKTCLESTRQFLQCDRVIVCRFDAAYNVVIELEAVSQPEFSLTGRTIEDPCFGQAWAERYREGYITVRTDAQASNIIPCYSEFLAQLQIRANLVVAILQANEIWGLLMAHQCHVSRQWQAFEVDLFKQLGLQIGIASQKASLYAQLEGELAVRRCTEQALAQKVQREQLLRTLSQQIRQSLRLDDILLTTVAQVQSMLQADRVLIFRFNRDRSGSVIQESTLGNCSSLAGLFLSGEHFPQATYESYLHGQARATPKADDASQAPCLVEFMQQIGVKSKTVAPIVQNQPHLAGESQTSLWGLLIAHSCLHDREWLPAEIDLLQQLATQVGIAIQQANLYTTLERQLAQKEVLLKEVHHRVKNNLQVISSMLWMQAEVAQHPTVSSALADTRSRIQAMALIHETLYRSNDLGQLNFHDYVQHLANSILAAHSTRPNQIMLLYHLQPVAFNLETAIPCGLLLNELITNAVKHAFPNCKQGEIRITLERHSSMPAALAATALPESQAVSSSKSKRVLSAPQYVLTVQDNGVGIPGDLDLKNLNSLGLKIAYDLALQLRGTLELERTQGTLFRFTFSELEYRQRF
jgi:PAS domain S-box-containing protein